MRRTEGRFLKAYAVLLLLCLPFALRDPISTLPGMVPVLALEHRLFHPSLWFPSAEASEAGCEDWEPLPFEKSALLRLEKGLNEEVNPMGRERLKVRRAEGLGGGGWPDLLLVEREWSDEDLGWLDGTPVVRGMDLLGFVHTSQRPEERHRLQSRGLLPVRLLNHRGKSRESRRYAALARSIEPDLGDSPRPIRLILGASKPKDPFPLRSLRSSPEQADTRTHGPFLARLMDSEVLHPSLPEDLILGWVRDVVYEKEGFVQSRWVLPRWHPLGLVQVELLAGPGVASQGKSMAIKGDSWPAAKRIEARVIWRSPEHLGYRRYLLRGSGLEAGMAVLSGARCLGRVEWALGGIALAAPLSKRGSRFPMLWWGGASRRVEALVVEGLGSSRNQDHFRLLHPAMLDPARVDQGFLDEGILFTGTMGRGFPAGLLISDAFQLHGTTLSLQSEPLLSWPDTVELCSMQESAR